MLKTVLPICFNVELSEAHISNCETSNGIYISGSVFSHFMTDANDEFIALELKHNNHYAYCHITGIHSADTNVIFAPGWICNMLCADNEETISITRVYPSIGTKITIKPQNSSYTELDDPVEALRNAFESYSCLMAGIEIPLSVGGKLLNVAINDVSNSGPICIRGVELEVEIAEDLEHDISGSTDFGRDEPFDFDRDEPFDFGPDEPFDFGPMIPMPDPINPFPGSGRMLKDYNRIKRVRR